MKKCSNCAAVLDDTVNFCNICGGSAFSPVNPDPGPYYTDSGYHTLAAPRKKPGKGLIIGCIAGGAVLVAAVVVTLILTNPVRRFMNSIEAMDVTTASQIYYESIYGNAGRSESVDAKLTEYVEEQMTLYLGEEISYDELSARLLTIDYAGVYLESLYDTIEYAAFIHNCRETWSAAEEAFAGGDYGRAVMLYAQIAGADFESGDAAADRLAQATETYRNSVLLDVKSYMTDHSYDFAYLLLNEALGILPGDSTLESVYEECVQAEYDYTITCLIDEVQVYCDANDYLGALTFLDEQIGAYPDEIRLTDARNATLTAFEEYVITESLRLAREGEYDHAASLAASGLSCFESAEVTGLHQIYLSYIPVLLGDMEIFINDTKGGSWASYTNEKDSYQQDNYGNTYSHSFSVGCGSVTYLVNFKYQTFSGTVAFPKGLTADSFRESATLTVYGDDKEIAVFRDVTDSSRPEAFTLDISAYEKITLTWDAEGANIWEDWGDFATIFDGLLIPIPVELP